MQFTNQQIEQYSVNYGLNVETVRCLALICDTKKEFENECKTIGTDEYQLAQNELENEENFIETVVETEVFDIEKFI